MQPLLDSLSKNPRREGYLSGQDVVVPGRDDLRVVIALDSDNDTHLLISPVAIDTKFSQFDFRGLKIGSKNWIINGSSTQSYLDISCATGELPSFSRPFIKFCEDVLFEVSHAGVAPAEAVYRTGLRWKRFWTPDLREVTREWLYGMCGELTFLMELIQKVGPAAVKKWTGPLGKDHDFQVGTTVGIEVKVSAEMPFKIQCNIRQLDPTIFKKLYVVCYKVGDSESGTSLPDLVKRIEKLIGESLEDLDSFYERLAAAGYNRQLESVYREHAVSISSSVVFHVDSDFPKITEGDFTEPPDHRISAIRYSLQLTGLKELAFNDIADDLVMFGNSKK